MSACACGCGREATGTLRDGRPVLEECAKRDRVVFAPFVEATTTTATATTTTPTTETKPKKPRTTRPRRDLDPEELAHREAFREHKATMRRAVEGLSPAMVADGERVKGEVLKNITKAKIKREIVRIERPSGTGGPGSALVVTIRSYDGSDGGEPTDYLLLHVQWRSPFGTLWRSQGLRVLKSEINELIVGLSQASEVMNHDDGK